MIRLSGCSKASSRNNEVEMNVETCLASIGADCSPASCHGRCAVEVIDDLLSQSHAISGEQADLLLDLRWQLSRRNNAEQALRLFASLRMQLESHHYLDFYRIRRWLRNHIVARVEGGPVADRVITLPVKLDFYCLEAERRHCLCAALEEGVDFFAAKLHFEFSTESDADQRLVSAFVNSY